MGYDRIQKSHNVCQVIKGYYKKYIPFKTVEQGVKEARAKMTVI